MHQTYFYDGAPKTPEPAAPEVPQVPAAGPGPVPPPPPEPPVKPKKRRTDRGAAIFLVFLCLILGGTAVLLATQTKTVDIGPFLPAIRGEEGVQAPQATPRPHNGLVKAPAGDTVLTLAPKGDGAAKSLQEIYKEVNPAIVSISAVVSMGPVQGMAQGTGVIMSADGYIITNAHVIADSVSAEVSLEDGRSYHAQLAGVDPSTDLAVLKIDGKNLPVAVFGDSEDMEVGDTVAAIGNPMGEELRGTMTDGILSAINRNMEVGGNEMTLMQTTAALNTGNSGGALVNDQGQVIGITNMKLVSTDVFNNSVEGLGFAIPSSTVKDVVDDLIAHGHVTGRPTLGVTVQPLTAQELEEQGLEHGLWVRGLEPKSDAAEKLKEGDILVIANGRDLDTSDDLLEVREGLEPGDNIYFQLVRNKEAISVVVRVMERYELDE